MKTNSTIVINAQVLSSMRLFKAEDENFRRSLERTVKLASYVVARSNWQAMIDAGTFAGTISNPSKSLEIAEENKERLAEALSKFYKAFIWLCGETKRTTHKSLVEQYISFEEDVLVEAASALLSTEVEITRINAEGTKRLLAAVNAVATA